MTKYESVRCRYCGTYRTDPPEQHWQYCRACPRIPSDDDDGSDHLTSPRTYDNEGHVIDYPAIVLALRHGSCWCGVGIGNPMMKGEHTPLCLYIQSFMPREGEQFE